MYVGLLPHTSAEAHFLQAPESMQLVNLFQMMWNGQGATAVWVLVHVSGGEGDHLFKAYLGCLCLGLAGCLVCEVRDSSTPTGSVCWSGEALLQDFGPASHTALVVV